MVVSHGRSAQEKQFLAPRSRFHGGRFGRMFRHLPAWRPPGADEAAQARFVRDLARAAFAPLSGNQDGPIPAAYTYLGQFIDHDITFDPRSSLSRANDPEGLENFRTPVLELDSVYGSGPDDQPYMYERKDPRRFLIGKAVPPGQPGAPSEDDLPRNDEQRALIGDKRNDENTIVSQLHLAFLKLHNALLPKVEAAAPQGADVFALTQREVRWRYQYVVLNDFLARVCGGKLVKKVLAELPGRPRLPYYDPEHRPFIPVEFSGAAYRFGHSLVRASYHLNDVLQGLREGSPFPEPIPLFGDDEALDTLMNLRGSRRLPTFWTIQWDRFVGESGAAGSQMALKIDPGLADPLRRLSASAAGPVAPDVANLADLDQQERERPSLAFLNLMRGWRLGLPSGQAVARLMCEHRPLPPLPGGVEHPLWLYVLEEARVHEGGERLGPVGSQIVLSVLLGLLLHDGESYLRVDPRWHPPKDVGGRDYKLADLLREAGVPMRRADLPPPFPPAR